MIYFSQYVAMVGHPVNGQVPTENREIGVCSMVQQHGDYIRVS